MIEMNNWLHRNININILIANQLYYLLNQSENVAVVVMSPKFFSFEASLLGSLFRSTIIADFFGFTINPMLYLILL